ncbi:MAG: methylmalonyl Co-A mutase-associated GTPase MeaB, partial [Rhodospirillales bacterium]|nr:methylmalonyl Co-A mutase-associated GTPase MeaB [Rhodospirillales bacterium]
DADEIKAKQAVIHYRNALHIMAQRSPNWPPPVTMCSAVKNTGIDNVWTNLTDYRDKLTETGEFQEKRKNQRWKAMWSMLQDRLMTDLKAHPQVKRELAQIKDDLHDGRLTVTLAVEKLLALSRG